MHMLWTYQDTWVSCEWCLLMQGYFLAREDGFLVTGKLSLPGDVQDICLSASVFQVKFNRMFNAWRRYQNFQYKCSETDRNSSKSVKSFYLYDEPLFSRDLSE